MINYLVQKRGLSTRTFTLFNDHILVDNRTIKKNDKYEIRLDKIGYDIHYQSDSIVLGKIFLYICIAVPVFVWLLFFFQPQQMDENSAIQITVFCLLLVLFNVLKKHKDDIYLTGGQRNLIFFRTVPNEDEVLKFIKQITNTSKNYLKTKYATVDVNIPNDIFLERLNWLKEREVINETEFNELNEE